MLYQSSLSKSTQLQGLVKVVLEILLEDSMKNWHNLWKFRKYFSARVENVNFLIAYVQELAEVVIVCPEFLNFIVKHVKWRLMITTKTGPN